MAKTLDFLIFTIFLLVSAVNSHSFSREISPENLGLEKEKLTHLHFYFHDIITSKNPTAIPITKPPNNSSSDQFGFGTIFMADDPLTEEPDINSKLVGKAQGLYAVASQTDIEFLMVFNFVFTEDKYNGSTLSLLGHNAIFSGVREMPIVGGSKIFRFARGYALAKTHAIDLKTNNAVVEYNVHVFHY